MADTPEFLKYDDELVQVTLKRGLMIDGTKVMVMTMREPSVADQIAGDKMKGSQAEVEVSIFANLCEVTPDQIKGLKMADYSRLQQAYTGFID